MGEEISIYIDDSGQLHSNYHSNYFVYGGFWCFSKDEDDISRKYGLMMTNIYRTKKEVKSSAMSDSKKRKVLRRLFRDHGHQFNPIYVASYIPDVTIDFFNKSAVQLHKNYILRRLVEDVINDLQRHGVILSKINVYIDNQSQTTVSNRDSFEVYIVKWFRGSGNYLAQSFTQTQAVFHVDFMDSSAFRAMQFADLLANTKFCRYHNGCLDTKNIFSEFSKTPLCRKHPKFFVV